MNTIETYSPAGLHRIMTSTARARSDPGGFIGSIWRRRRMDDIDYQPEKKCTQEEQDVEDEEARKQALKNLINSWQERLQLISVITTFFASTEAAMLVNTKPADGTEWANSVLQVANASFLGGLVVHVYASVLSFLGAFLLISYKLREAKREEMIMEGIPVNSPLGATMVRDVERDSVDLGMRRTRTANDAQSMTHGSVNSTVASVTERNKNDPHLVESPVFSANPHVEQVGPFESHALSSRVLRRTHTLCVFFAAVGFMLNIVGVMCYCWALQPPAVSIFASVCLGGTLLTLLALFL